MAISTKAKKEVIFFFYLSKLAYSAALISFYSKLTQLYMNAFFFLLFSATVYLRRLDIVPCAIHQGLVVYPL